jgi:hypothetical protein
MKSTYRVWLIWAGWFLLGVFAVLLVRFFSYNSDSVHYHANFALYIQGQREQFKDPSYYEEETACKSGKDMTPTDRAHMHDNISDIVHVHDHATTWGQFFNNLGWSIGRDFIETRDQMYQNDGNNVLHVILNGQDLTGINPLNNKVIGDRDKLLLSFGNVTSVDLQKQYQAVPSTAKVHDEENDPASCSGPSATTISDRLHHLF